MMRIKNIHLSYLDAFFFALMVGAGETYFAAYSLSIGHSGLKAGLLVTVPLALGGIFQLFTPWFLNTIKNYKIWICFCALIQVLIFLCFICVEKISYQVLFSLICLYWTLFFSSSSVWNSWMAKLIGKDEYNSFFTKRNSFQYIGILLGLVLSGFSLQYGFSYESIFLFCLFCRLLSLVMIFFIQDSTLIYEKIPSFSFNVIREFASYREVLPIGIFALYFKLSVFVSASFFTPYMLKFLHFSYMDYMLILSMSFIGRIITMRYFKKIINEIQMQRVFLLACAVIAIIPALWYFESSFKFLLILEIFTGIFWGVFEIIFLLSLFEKLSPERNAGFMMSFNFWNSLAIGLGTLIGGGLFTFYPEDMQIKNYALVFLASSGLRFLSLFFVPDMNLKTITVRMLPFVRPMIQRTSNGFIGRNSFKFLKKDQSDK